jgi:O-antigen/teichoic acid export membrane protein
MNPWLFITLVLAAIIFGIDYLLRKKKWENNTKEEKISLLVNMFSAGLYAFLSAVGLLWGIASDSPKTAFGEVIYNATLMMGSIYFVIALVAVIVSLILRKYRKIKASIVVNAVALAYIVIVLFANYIVGIIL